MSMFGSGAQIGSSLPQGRLIGNYRSYEAVIEVVDRAVEAGVDPRFLSIVGRDMRSVYRLRHRPSYAAVAGRGAMQGAFFGMFIGLIISMMSGGEGIVVSVGSTILLGAVIWVLFGVLGEMMRRKQLKYAVLPSMTAVSFDLVADQAVAGQVAAALGTQPQPQPTPTQTPGVPPVQHQPPTQQQTARPDEPSEQQSDDERGIPDLPDGRPQYGVRVDPKPRDDDSPQN